MAPSLKGRFQKLLGSRVEVIWIPNSEADPIAGDLAWVEDIVFDMALRARNAMPFGGQLVIEWANIRLDDATVGLHPGKYVMFEMTCLRQNLSDLSALESGLPLPAVPDWVLPCDFGQADKLISAAGGQICEYNEPGRALTIRAFFPCASDTSNSAQEFSVNDESQEVRILLVEDEGYVRDVACEILESEGYKVLTARSGKEALEVFRDGRPIHLLVTDVVMPGMNGHDLAEHLTALYPELKTIYMSGYTDNFGVTARHELNPTFIQKPFTLESLTSKVKEMLNPAAS